MSTQTEVTPSQDGVCSHPTLSIRAHSPPHDSSAAAKEGSSSSNNPKNDQLLPSGVEVIEMAELGSTHGNAVPSATTVFPAASPRTRRIASIHFVTLCWTLFLAGWNDGTTGPLLTRIQDIYHVRQHDTR